MSKESPTAEGGASVRLGDLSHLLMVYSMRLFHVCTNHAQPLPDYYLSCPLLKMVGGTKTENLIFIKDYQNKFLCNIWALIVSSGQKQL